MTYQDSPKQTKANQSNISKAKTAEYSDLQKFGPSKQAYKYFSENIHAPSKPLSQMKRMTDAQILALRNNPLAGNRILDMHRNHSSKDTQGMHRSKPRSSDDTQGMHRSHSSEDTQSMQGNHGSKDTQGMHRSRPRESTRSEPTTESIRPLIEQYPGTGDSQEGMRDNQNS